MDALHLLVLALATWRCASLLAVEDGPFEVFAKLRKRLGVEYDGNGIPFGTNWLAKGVPCVWCSSVWMGTLWTVLYLLLGKYAVWVAMPLAFSAVAVLIQERVGR